MNAHNHSSATLSYIIASVYRSNTTDIANKHFHNEAIDWFKEYNVPFKVVEGGYRHSSGHYVTEAAILFPAKYWNLFAFLFTSQESILVLSELEDSGRRSATLRYLDLDNLENHYLGDSRYLGHFNQVSRDTALANDAGYTRDGHTYYIAA